MDIAFAARGGRPNRFQRVQLPVNGLDPGLGSQIEQAEIKHGLGAFADFVSVMESISNRGLIRIALP
jgi:hypothetical protein